MRKRLSVSEPLWPQMWRRLQRRCEIMYIETIFQLLSTQYTQSPGNSYIVYKQSRDAQYKDCFLFVSGEIARKCCPLFAIIG